MAGNFRILETAAHSLGLVSVILCNFVKYFEFTLNMTFDAIFLKVYHILFHYYLASHPVSWL